MLLRPAVELKRPFPGFFFQLAIIQRSEAALLQEYYGQLRENNWSLCTDFKGYVGARYDL